MYTDLERNTLRGDGMLQKRLVSSVIAKEMMDGNDTGLLVNDRTCQTCTIITPSSYNYKTKTQQLTSFVWLSHICPEVRVKLIGRLRLNGNVNILRSFLVQNKQIQLPGPFKRNLECNKERR